MENFEKIIREIFYYIAEYGIKHKPLDFTNIENISKKDKQEFTIQVHKGFRLGQDIIVKQIIPLFQEKDNLKKEKLEARQKQEKESLKKVNHKIRLIEYKIKLLRHFADLIAWQVFKNDYYKARRFFSGDRNRPDLLNTNFESVLKAVNHFHKLNDFNFALISDLTTFIDIGDILLIEDKGISVIECKEGDVQNKVYEFLDDLITNDLDIKNFDFTGKDQKFFKQAERTLKQIEKGTKLMNFLKNEEGTDPFSDTKIKVHEATNTTEYYHKYLIELLKESEKNNSTYGEVDEIVYIGIYRENKIPISPYLFKNIVNQIYENNIIVDYVSIIGMPLKEPLFFKPFGEEPIFDLMFGRLKIFLAINLDRLIALFNKNGIKTEWLSRKQTHKLIDTNKNFKAFIYKNRAIKVWLNDESIILGDSFLVYILFDNVTPQSFVQRFKTINLKGSNGRTKKS